LWCCYFGFDFFFLLFFLVCGLLLEWVGINYSITLLILRQNAIMIHQIQHGGTPKDVVFCFPSHVIQMYGLGEFGSGDLFVSFSF